METQTPLETSHELPQEVAPAALAAPQPAILPQASLEPQGCGCNSNPTSAPAPASTGGDIPDTRPGLTHVYALGSIRPVFPSIDVEKEFAQAVREGDTANLTDKYVLYEIISKPENRYLAEELCWVFSIRNIDTYILQHVSDSVLDELIESLKPQDGEVLSAVIGVLGPISAPDGCNGIQLPQVGVKKLYSFEVEKFVEEVPQRVRVDDNVVRELFQRIIQLADNAGATAEHRALNYVALRYPEIYVKATEMFAENKSLDRVEVQPSRLTGTRHLLNIIFTYVDRTTDVRERYYVRADATAQFPFLVNKLEPYYDR